MTYKEALEYARVGLKVSQRDYPELTTRLKSQEAGIAALEDALKWHKSTEETPIAEGQYLCCVIKRDGSPYFAVWTWSNNLYEVADWLFDENIGAGFYSSDVEGYYKVKCDYWKEIRWTEDEL